MAGDHKCPVCSSTFTRPQHVARHMRSHTGDRPYKCTHCGDQFARSDLLSRHVNKCHASEKPATTTQPAPRRRGHAQPGSSTSGVRGPAPALIPPPGSRKICDVCASSRTPAQCDSALPCGKCLQRNSKCTYVKTDTARRSYSLPEVFAPPATVPSMAGPPPATDGLFPSTFDFNAPLYPDAPSAAGPSSYAFDSSRNQASRLGYTTDQAVAHTATQSALGMPYGYPGSGTDVRSTASSGESPAASKNALLDAYLDATFPLAAPTYLYNHNTADGGHTTGTSSLMESGIQRTAALEGQQQQQHTQQMPPPLPVHTQIDYAFLSRHQQQQLRQQQQQQQATHSTQNSPTPGQAQATASGNPNANGSFNAGSKSDTVDPGVSSAFGLMSLDDPAISAEMSRNHSFFAPGALHNLPLPSQLTLSTGLTPSTTGPPLGIGLSSAGLLTPNLGLGGFGLGLGGATGLTPGGPFGETGLTPGKEGNTAELRDFWKMFLKTPGERTPGVNGLGDESGENASGGANSNALSDGTRSHRPISKMASLPDIKTPGGGPAFGHLTAAQQNQLSSHNPNANAATQQNFSAREDLRSYEMAVLARQAPLLKLPKKQRTGSLGTSQAPGQRLTPESNTSSPSSTSSTVSQQPKTSASNARHPQAPLAAPAGGLSARRLSRSDRPSFKRVASSTLAPFEAKSAKMTHRTFEDNENDAEWADKRFRPPPPPRSHSQSSGYQQRSPSVEYPVGLAPQTHHARRLSAPSTAGDGRPVVM